MIESLIKDGYSVEVIDKNSSKMLNKNHKSKIAVILNDLSNEESYKLNSEYMSKYQEVRVFNKSKEK